jgi:hypothetical protein
MIVRLGMFLLVDPGGVHHSIKPVAYSTKMTAASPVDIRDRKLDCIMQCDW